MSRWSDIKDNSNPQSGTGLRPTKSIVMSEITASTNQKSKPMICPECEVEMNHHAEKIDYAAALEEPTAIDPAFGGVVQEIHTCPECGRIMTRPRTA
jgi:ribosomal protein S27AE